METDAVAVQVTSATNGHDLVLTAEVAVGPGQRGWLPLAAALALADTLRTAARVPAEVLWPDAVTLPRAMCGGAGTVQQVAVTGVDGTTLTARLTLTGSALDLPPGRTSVWAEGGRADGAQVAAGYAAALGVRLAQLADGDPGLAADYRARCVTFGRLVEVAGRQGWVSALADDGSLLATVDGALVPVPAQALAR